MKKKIAPIIIVSSVGLLLGGLIYLGVSAFPELLESEEEKAVKAEEHRLVPFASNTVAFENDDNVEEPTEDLVISSSSHVLSNDYAPSSFNVNKVRCVDTSRDLKLTITSFDDWTDCHFVEVGITFVSENSTETIDEPISIEISQEETTNVEHISYASFSEEKETTPVQVSKTKKAKSSYKNTVRSNEALIETSLIVVGAVDLMSVILIRRKKRLFR